MKVTFENLTPNQRYHLITQTIIPRPIAWLLSENRDHSLNLAPFSFFAPICSDPVIFMVSIGRKTTEEGVVPKDTLLNLTEGRPCVVHIANCHQLDMLNSSSSTLEYGQSEIEQYGIEVKQVEGWPLPRIENCPIAGVGKMSSVVSIGHQDQQVVFIELTELFIDDHTVKAAPTSENAERITVDAKAVNPLARLGAGDYAALGDILSATRPK